MATLPTLIAHTDNAPGVVNGNPSLSPLHKNDCPDNRNHQGTDGNKAERRKSASAGQSHGINNGRRNRRHNTSENDKRDAVADPTLGYLLPKPHDKCRASSQGDNGKQDKSHTGIGNHHFAGRPPHRLKTHSNACALNDRQYDGSVPRILGNLLFPSLALLGKLLYGFKNNCKKLKDNRGADIRHDPESKNRHTLQGATGKGTDQPEKSPLGSLEKTGQNLAVDTGGRNMTPDTVNHQHTERKKNASAKFGDTEYISQARDQFKSPRLCRRPQQFFPGPTC